MTKRDSKMDTTVDCGLVHARRQFSEAAICSIFFNNHQLDFVNLKGKHNKDYWTSAHHYRTKRQLTNLTLTIDN